MNILSIDNFLALVAFEALSMTKLRHILFLILVGIQIFVLLSNFYRIITHEAGHPCVLSALFVFDGVVLWRTYFFATSVMAHLSVLKDKRYI